LGRRSAQWVAFIEVTKAGLLLRVRRNTIADGRYPSGKLVEGTRIFSWGELISYNTHSMKMFRIAADQLVAQTMQAASESEDAGDRELKDGESETSH
jgi:hypothetical protein